LPESYVCGGRCRYQHHAHMAAVRERQDVRARAVKLLAWGKRESESDHKYAEGEDRR